MTRYTSTDCRLDLSGERADRDVLNSLFPLCLDTEKTIGSKIKCTSILSISDGWNVKGHDCQSVTQGWMSIRPDVTNCGSSCSYGVRKRAHMLSFLD